MTKEQTKNREKLESLLLQQIREIREDKLGITELKKSLLKIGLLPGDVQSIINEKMILSKLDFSLLYFLTTKVYDISKAEVINPEKYFTENEIKLASQYKVPHEEKVGFPIIFKEVIQLTPEDFITSINIQELVKLFASNLFVYNFDTQRNAKFRKRGNVVLKVPRIEPKSVKEIAQKVLDGVFFPDMITLNVLAGSSQGKNDEILFDSKNRQLVINESEIDILDGFHRINGFLEAISRNPQLSIEIPVTIKNYNIRNAQSYIAQVNTINRIDPVYLKSLKADRYSDYIVKELQRESDLRGRISETGRISKVVNHLVSYNVLADTIDEVFANELKTKKDAMEIAQYLIRFFDYLLGSYAEEFNDYNSLMSNNNMFVGYIVLAKRMKDESIPLNLLPDIISIINYDIDNPVWREYDILVDGRIITKARQNIIKLFGKVKIPKQEKEKYHE